MRIFREEATAALAGSSILQGQIGIWSVGFMEGGKPEDPEKNPCSKERTNNKLNPRITLGRN